MSQETSSNTDLIDGWAVQLIDVRHLSPIELPNVVTYFFLGGQENE